MNNKSAIGTNTTSPGRECEPAGASDADRASCMLMEAADFFAATHAQADPRAWKHLLVYLPETSVESGVEELCKELESPVDERTVGSTTETRKFYDRLHIKAATVIRKLEMDVRKQSVYMDAYYDERVRNEIDDRYRFSDDDETYIETWEAAKAMREALEYAESRATAAEAEVERLRKALEPFANAAKRIDYFDGLNFNARLWAWDYGIAMRELLNGIDGEPITVQQLRAARTAWEGKSDG